MFPLCVYVLACCRREGDGVCTCGTCMQASWRGEIFHLIWTEHSYSRSLMPICVCVCLRLLVLTSLSTRYVPNFSCRRDGMRACMRVRVLSSAPTQARLRLDLHSKQLPIQYVRVRVGVLTSTPTRVRLRLELLSNSKGGDLACVCVYVSVCVY